MAVLALDIGGTKIAAATYANSNLTQLARVPTPTGDLQRFVDCIAQLHERATEVSAIAISLAGVIDPETGMVTSANIPAIHQSRLGKILQSVLSKPVIIANDADCFALAEAVLGAGRGHNSVFGLILGTGVGGGLVLNKQLVQGAGGFAGEWGHGPFPALVELSKFNDHIAQLPGRIEASSKVLFPAWPCGCGLAGCLDVYGGARGLERIHSFLHRAQQSSEAIVESWQQGEQEAALTIECFLQVLAGPLTLLINTFGASCLPVGGGVSNAKKLIEQLDKKVRAKSLCKHKRPIIVPAQLGSDAGQLGAALLAQRGQNNDS
ncbi:ROK family protein [Polycladidibacter hongkongensis]|uniref:ROK family protein n=1 Tax=Polycladidibacter hongkongensis TaxID=1647556 RepID=UPI000835F04A|nr:ROK family protein [Pseudovibrio hongkongensis]